MIITQLPYECLIGWIRSSQDSVLQILACICSCSISLWVSLRWMLAGLAICSVCQKLLNVSSTRCSLEGTWWWLTIFEGLCIPFDGRILIAHILYRRTTPEAYLETSRTSTMELFYKKKPSAIFSKTLYPRCSTGF